MPRRSLHASFLGALAVILLLGGCTTPAPETKSVSPTPSLGPSSPINPTAPVAPVTPPKPATPAVPVVELKPATITGSEESSTMLDNLTVYVTAIDGQAVTAGRQGWHIPLTLKPGVRKLKVAFNRGVFTAETDLLFTAQSEHAYQLLFATDAQLFGKNSYCEFWIEDTATHQKAIQPRRVPLLRVESGK
jgi:hypothetical protein